MSPFLPPLLALPQKRKIETKYRLPRLNWVAIPPTMIAGTVFKELDDESILRALDFDEFEELFKTKGQSSTDTLAVTEKSERPARKPAKESLLDTNRSQNISIARKKVTCSSKLLKGAITRYVAVAHSTCTVYGNVYMYL